MPAAHLIGREGEGGWDAIYVARSQTDEQLCYPEYYRIPSVTGCCICIVC